MKLFILCFFFKKQQFIIILKNLLIPEIIFKKLKKFLNHLIFLITVGKNLSGIFTLTFLLKMENFPIA